MDLGVTSEFVAIKLVERIYFLSNPNFGGKLPSETQRFSFSNTHDQRGVSCSRLNQHGGSGHQSHALHFTQSLWITV